MKKSAKMWEEQWLRMMRRVDRHAVEDWRHPGDSIDFKPNECENGALDRFFHLLLKAAPRGDGSDDKPALFACYCAMIFRLAKGSMCARSEISAAAGMFGVKPKMLAAQLVRIEALLTRRDDDVGAHDLTSRVALRADETPVRRSTVGGSFPEFRPDQVPKDA